MCKAGGDGTKPEEVSGRVGWFGTMESRTDGCLGWEEGSCDMDERVCCFWICFYQSI